MNKSDFESKYAKQSGVSVDWLHEHGQNAVPCHCEEQTCEGWAMYNGYKSEACQNCAWWGVERNTMRIDNDVESRHCGEILRATDNKGIREFFTPENFRCDNYSEAVND